MYTVRVRTIPYRRYRLRCELESELLTLSLSADDHGRVFDEEWRSGRRNCKIKGMLEVIKSIFRNILILFLL